MIEFQRKILGDAVRNAAFARALAQAIVPGKTIVADLGSGTGFLSFLAIKLGARCSHLYETSPGLLALSKRLARENGIQECTFHATHTRAVTRPVQADVVVSETLGNFAYEEHILETMEDAKRFLKPGGTLIPQSITQYVAPVIGDRLRKEINIWGDIGHDLDFSALEEATLNNMYVKAVRTEDLLSEDSARVWDRVDFCARNASRRNGTVSWNVMRSVQLCGLALWWECALLPGIILATSPGAARTHWEQDFLPLLSPLSLQRGDFLSATITSDSRRSIGLVVTWTVIAKRRNRVIATQTLDTRRGYIV